VGWQVASKNSYPERKLGTSLTLQVAEWRASRTYAVRDAEL